MISRTRYGRAVLLILAAGLGVASVLPAGAQTASSGENPQATAAEAAAPDANDADIRDTDIRKRARAAKCRGPPKTSQMARPHCR